MALDGLTCINIELTDRCNKKCWMCGRRKIDALYPEIAEKRGDMDFELLKKIQMQLPKDVVVQLHQDGEPMLYPRLKEAIELFDDQITNIVTNGKLLVEKADDIIGKLDTLSISVIENDHEADEQYGIIEKFLEMKEDQKPLTIIKLVGKVDGERYKKFNAPITKRTIASPMGTFDYEGKQPAMPEIGICWDFLHHLTVKKNGDVHICPTFDPDKIGFLGNVNESSLDKIWDGEKRRKWLGHHVKGERKKVPLCADCDYWGVPNTP